jgi:proline iminopeptidase
VLVMAGEHDPVCPIEGSEEFGASLPPDVVQFQRFAHSGPGVFRDELERSMRVLREFVTSWRATRR